MPTKLTQKMLITHQHGLHMRPASIFAKVAQQYDADVRVQVGRQAVDGKSVLELLSLCVERGGTITVVIEGKDAPTAFQALKDEFRPFFREIN